MFTSWLLSEINQRGWSQAELARRAKVSKGAISHVLNGARNPGIELCEAIASAFGYPVDVVFSAAGILPKPPGWTADRAKWNAAFDGLDPEDQEEFLAMVEARINTRKRKAQSSDKLNPGGVKA